MRFKTITSEGKEGFWGFMGYYPHGCEEIKDCEMDLHINTKEEEGEENRKGITYKVMETKLGKGCTDEEREPRFLHYINFDTETVTTREELADRGTKTEFFWSGEAQRLQFPVRGLECF